MTKNEMIKQVEDLLWHYTDTLVSVTHKEIAKEVVELCLKNGMKPPVEKHDAILLRTEHTWGKEE